MSLGLLKRPAVFGAADGVTIALGLLVSLAGQPHALIRASAGAALAELVGMTAGAWLSDEAAGWRPALANGAAAFAACIAPALPYAAMRGAGALACSLGLIAAVASVIAVLRPERGVLAWVQTYGILAVAAALCAAASAI